MFDTMVLTKAVAGICATLLLFLVGKWAADVIYMPAKGHGDDHHAAVYPVFEEDQGGAEEVVEEEAVDILALYAEADPAAGESLWRNCRACHALDGTDGTGPHLDGVVGREIGGVEGFNYSGAMRAAFGDTWTVEALASFLENPRNNAPGTRMNFRGFSNPQDQVNMIAYLESVSP
jgi:cytochrome c